MKKSVKLSVKGLFLLIVVALIISLFFNVIVSGEEIKKFDPNDPRTWQYGTDNELKSINSESIYARYTGYPQVIENLWNKFDEKAKNDFLETEILRKTKLKITLEGLGNKDLKFKDGKLTDSKGAIFDINNFPKDLKKISYDSQKGFIYEYSDGKKITLDNGGVDKEGKTYGTKDGKNDGVIHLTGEIVIKGNKINLVDEKSSISINGKSYLFGESKGLPSYVMIFGKEVYGANNVKMVSLGEAIINIPTKDTVLIFNEGDPLKISGIGNQYFQLYGKTLRGVGEGSVNILKSFDEVSIKGSAENGITIYNGETKDYAIKFQGDQTDIPRTIKEAPFDIANIDNVLDTKRHYSLGTNENGARYFSDNQKTIVVGNVYVNYKGKEQNQEGVGKAPNLLTAVSTSFSLGKIDQENIPEGLSKQDYLAYLSQSKDKAVEFKFNQITDNYLNKLITTPVKEAIGGEFFNKLKTISDKAAEYGFIEPMNKEQFDDKIDKKIAENGREIIRLMDLAIKEKVEPKFREVSSNIPTDEFLNSLFSNQILQGVTGIDVSSSLGSASGAANGAKAYVDYSDAIQKVYGTYGKIPADTKVRLVLAGDSAYGLISPPVANIKVGDQWKKVEMDPIKFPINTNTANLLINKANQQSDRLNGWNKYSENQKKK